MQKQLWGQNEKLFRILGNQGTKNKYPIVNNIITIYVAVVLITFVLFQIAPFVTIIAKTPFYSIQTYLGLIGGLLLCIDLFTNKVLWRGKYCIFLYGICISALISTICMAHYGIMDNIFSFCWIVIQFSLVYSCAMRMETAYLRKYISWLFTIILIIWIISVSVSIFQYLAQIGYCYEANPISDNPELVRQGFLNNRLFGVFMGLDYAVFISLILMIGAIFYFSELKGNLVKRVVFMICIALLVIHIILTGSRSVQIALYLYLFFYSLLMIRNRFLKTCDRSRILLCVCLSLIITFCGFFGFVGAKEGLSRVIYYTESMQQHYIEKDHSAKDTNLKENQIETEDQVNDSDENVLKREELDDISNNRFSIWKDYLSLFDDIGLFGLSLANYNDYISDHFPDLYIVEYFSEMVKDSGKTDLVYECHNNYLFVFIAAGWFGGLLLLSYFCLIFLRILKYITSHKVLSSSFIALLAIVCVLLVDAFFMNSIFLKLNALSFIFWFILGVLSKEICFSKGTEDVIMQNEVISE